MSTSKKTPAANRHHGGPGSSNQDATKPHPVEHGKSATGGSTNPDTSTVSGGGGERDAHHHHSNMKGLAPDRSDRSH